MISGPFYVEVCMLKPILMADPQHINALPYIGSGTNFKCIGVEYDFPPPTVSVYYAPNSISPNQELAEANIDWDYDEKYNKERT